MKQMKLLTIIEIKKMFKTKNEAINYYKKSINYYKNDSWLYQQPKNKIGIERSKKYIQKINESWD